ncbi:MAG: YdeI/OmpD-associated family protein [Candidatus Microsaccharimonas sp.]
MIHFKSLAQKVGKWTILKLPQNESKKLPSRGQVMVNLKIQGHTVVQVLEPDGRGGRWFKLPPDLLKNAKITTGTIVSVSIELTEKWQEPVKPQDFNQALKKASPFVQQLWQDITPMARWEWVRWINATTVPETRVRRIQVSISKMQSGKRRPCCFNLASCTDPNLSRGGKLIEPTVK